jgi:hypothetical protein
MTSLLDLNFDEITDLKPADEGETKIRVLNGKVGFGKDSGNPYFMVQFEIPDQANTKDFNWIVMLPTDQMDQKKAEAKGRALKGFCNAFNLDLADLWSKIKQLAGATTAGEIESVVGAEGWAILGMESDDYGDKNRIKKFL